MYDNNDVPDSSNQIIFLCRPPAILHKSTILYSLGELYGDVLADILPSERNRL